MGADVSEELHEYGTTLTASADSGDVAILELSHEQYSIHTSVYLGSSEDYGFGFREALKLDLKSFWPRAANMTRGMFVRADRPGDLLQFYKPEDFLEAFMLHGYKTPFVRIDATHYSRTWQVLPEQDTSRALLGFASGYSPNTEVSFMLRRYADPELGGVISDWLGRVRHLGLPYERYHFPERSFYW